MHLIKLIGEIFVVRILKMLISHSALKLTHDLTDKSSAIKKQHNNTASKWASIEVNWSLVGEKVSL